MLLTFKKERLVFDSRDLLDDYSTKIINLPISIEIKYYNGVAPCGLALQINESDLQAIENILHQHDITVDHIYMEVNDDKEYKRVR